MPRDIEDMMVWAKDKSKSAANKLSESNTAKVIALGGLAAVLAGAAAIAVDHDKQADQRRRVAAAATNNTISKSTTMPQQAETEPASAPTATQACNSFTAAYQEKSPPAPPSAQAYESVRPSQSRRDYWNPNDLSDYLARHGGYW